MGLFMWVTDSTSMSSKENLPFMLSHLPPCWGWGGFVIICNLEMKTVRLRELVGLTPRLGAGGSEGNRRLPHPRLGADHSGLSRVPLISSPASLQTALFFMKCSQALFSLTSTVPAQTVSSPRTCWWFSATGLPSRPFFQGKRSLFAEKKLPMFEQERVCFP